MSSRLSIGVWRDLVQIILVSNILQTVETLLDKIRSDTPVES